MVVRGSLMLLRGGEVRWGFEVEVVVSGWFISVGSKDAYNFIVQNKRHHKKVLCLN